MLLWNGGSLIGVSPHNTSRTCPCCGRVSADGRQTQAQFRCIESGFEEHADLVGAINILSRRMQLLRDEGQDPGDASPRLREERDSPDGLGIESQWRSEAGTRRSDDGRAYSCVMP